MTPELSPPPSLPPIHRKLGGALQGRVRRRIVSADRRHVLLDTGFQKNLITDNFFSRLATTGTGAGFLANIPGGVRAYTGSTNPVRKDSTPVTLSQTGTTVTASGGFFAAGDVGNLLVFGGSGTGTNACYITAFTSSTQVTVNISQSVASVVGTVWYVATWASSGTTLNLTTAVSGSFSTSYSAGVYTYQFAYESGVQASAITLLQLALSYAGSSNPIALFQVPGAGDTVPINYFYEVTWQIQMTVTPSAPAAASNIGSGINTAGNIMVESVAGFSTLTSGGVAAAPSNLTLDGNATLTAFGQLTTNTYTQNTSVAAKGSEPVLTNTNGYGAAMTAAWAASIGTSQSTPGQVVGTFTCSISTTGNGSVITGLCILDTSAGKHVLLDQQLTTTYTSPGSGAYSFLFTYTSTITRTVVN